MKILITGATGFIGSKLSEHLTTKGHTLIKISRAVSDPKLFEGVEAVIHLAGEPIAVGRWTTQKKKRIYDSRVQGSKKLLQSIESLPRKPSVIISASAVGIYGHRGDEVLNEKSPHGTGFLAEVCKDWEQETIGHQLSPVRQVALRFGIVLGHGGALEKLLPIFRSGMGGPLGSGKQWMSWIHIDDLISLIDFALHNSSMTGAINAVSPEPETNERFSELLANVVGTKSWLPAPAFALKLALGEKAEMLLASQRVVPTRAIELGFKFKCAELRSAFDKILNS